MTLMSLMGIEMAILDSVPPRIIEYLDQLQKAGEKEKIYELLHQSLVSFFISSSLDNEYNRGVANGMLLLAQSFLFETEENELILVEPVAKVDKEGEEITPLFPVALKASPKQVKTKSDSDKKLDKIESSSSSSHGDLESKSDSDSGFDSNVDSESDSGSANGAISETSWSDNSEEN